MNIGYDNVGGVKIVIVIDYDWGFFDGFDVV